MEATSNPYADLDVFRRSVDVALGTVEKLEKQVNEVEQFYHSTDNLGTRKQLQGASCREAAAEKRMQELMRQFSIILHQITQHKGAWPFMNPVDVEGLGLHDYYEVIDKPMDFSTIKSKMEAKDSTVYKNVREIYSDVRLIFKNAMKYNDEKNDVHVMAKSLMKKFEEKWLKFLPKVVEEEKRQLEEELQARLDMHLAQEATYADKIIDLSNTLYEVDMHLKGLKEMVIRKYRRLSSQEKIILGTAITRLSPENLQRALEIVAENDPTFESNAEQMHLDIDAQSDYSLWRLKSFVKNALEVQGRTTGGIAVSHDDNVQNKKDKFKRRREFFDTFPKTTAKKARYLSTL